MRSDHSSVGLVPLYWRHADENLRARCRAGLLEMARSQARDDSRSTHDITADLLLANALKLSISPGNLRRTSETFAQLVQDIFNAWPQLAKVFRSGLSRLVKELPARQLHGLWRLVLQSRACDG
jgi:hypothetical protein